jgi:amino acid adenylation domain-containing protein
LPPDPRSLTDLLIRASRAHPRRTALEDGSRAVTYASLRDRAAALARVLKSRGLRPGGRVAVCLPRSVDAYEAVWGVLWAGGVYVPVDPRWPTARAAEVTRDAGASVLVVAPGPLPAGLRRAAPRVVAWGAGSDAASRPGGPPAARRGRDPAYILYTSGSTGRPKGVVLTHANALFFVGWAHRAFGLRPTDRLAGLSPLGFDLSVFELFNACRAGASLRPLAEGERVLPRAAVDVLRRARVTVLYAVPSWLCALASRGGLRRGLLPDLRRSLFAGEVFPAAGLRRWLAAAPRASFYNLYGPTETNVCLFHPVRRRPMPRTEPPIGRPLPGLRVRVCDAAGAVVPAGRPGELWVAGPAVMRGYWGRAAADVLVRSRRDVFYRTGDRVVRGARGVYRFLGRLDGQIKKSGYRVEPGEVEACLTSHPAVAEAAVVPRPSQGRAKELWAYLVPRGHRAPTGLLAGHCARRLPAYMRPDRYLWRAALPRTFSGKLDRRRLAAAGR